jgi:hypothetical protein
MHTPEITVARVAEIVAMQAVRVAGKRERRYVRNLQITQAYWRLSADLAAILGADNLNWCSFAIWASRNAGRFIRGEVIPAVVESLLARATGVARVIDDLLRFVGNQEDAAYARAGVLGALQAALDTIHDSITYGNKIVFAEIGAEFARFTAAVSTGELADRADLPRYLDGLRPGLTTEGGQGLLQDSFTHYWEALHATDPARKAQHILLANLLAAYHEQTRLDEAIDRAMGAPVSVALRGRRGHVLLDDCPAVLGTPFPGVPGHPEPGGPGADMRALIAAHLAPPAPGTACAAAAGSPAPAAGPHMMGTPPPRIFGRIMMALRRIPDHLFGALEPAWNRLATQYLMQMRLPGGDIYLGADVAPAAPGRDYPEVLEHIELPALRYWLERLDRNPGSRTGSRARDWSSLADRMNYACEFFRTRQCDISLMREPFTEEQRRIIDEGRIPEGPLY